MFKAENFQETGSFKIRGALSKLTALAKEENLDEVKFITASSGNVVLQKPAVIYAAFSFFSTALVILLLQKKEME